MLGKMEAVPGNGARAAAAVLEMASACPDREAFGREVLRHLDATVGYCSAFMLMLDDADPAPALVAEGYPADRAGHLRARLGAYAAELEPVKDVALRQGGVAVDTAVLGGAVGRRRYYRELVKPCGGGHSLLSFLTLRDRSAGVLMLGRRGAGFRAPEIDTLRGVRTALAVSLASFGGVRSSVAMAASLTGREREIASYLCLGYTNLEIGKALGTSAHTVRNQLATMFRKLEATTRAEAVGRLLGL